MEVFKEQGDVKKVGGVVRRVEGGVGQWEIVLEEQGDFKRVRRDVRRVIGCIKRVGSGVGRAGRC